ncbi:SCO0607 family lipoprotein [Streptomyces sp. NPDC051315]|uniref:SCO0607 family lipoprotein n=1 Tax=Streptomyces sp. NPDC051315 TaxID=3365650 RepID=UPI0037B7608C
MPLRTATPATPAIGRRAGRSVLGLALAGLTAALLTGCSLEEASCRGGEYPVLAVGNSGSACVPDGEEPPAGYARYPEGKVPEHVGDKWDEYWSTRTLDENGDIVKVPEAG